jgi:UDP-glucose 4-epimerase
MHWFITGGCGFIGTNLVERLLKEDSNSSITILDTLSVGTREDLSEVCKFKEIKHSDPIPLSDTNSVQLVIGDITDFEICFNSSKRHDIIVHLAANTGVPKSVEDPRKDFEVNVLGTFNMVEAARQNKVERFIFASSGAPLGEVELLFMTKKLQSQFHLMVRAN